MRIDKYCKLNIENKLFGIRGWIKSGLSIEEICRRLSAECGAEVSLADFNRWVKKYPQFRAAVSVGSDIADGELLNTAFNHANGYYIEQDEAFKVKAFEEIDGKMQPVEKVEVVRVRKYIMPSSTMNMFMLKNRFPQYADKRSEEGSGDLFVNVTLDERLDRWAK